MSQVSILLNLADEIKTQFDKHGHGSTILGLLVLLEKKCNNLKPFCQTGRALEYLEKAKILVREIKISLENSPILPEGKARELLDAAKVLAGLPTLQEV